MLSIIEWAVRIRLPPLEWLPRTCTPRPFIGGHAELVGTMGRYSDILMDHFRNPRNVGCLESADATGRSGSPGRPPFMVMYFRLKDETVTEVKYQTFGCGPAIATGSMLTEMITNRSIEQCMTVTSQQLIDALDLPVDKLWCANLAVGTMRNALGGDNGEAA